MKYKYKVNGLDCANCTQKLEDALNKKEEINDCVISFATGMMTFESNQEINDKIKPLYGKIKSLQAKANKYDRILQYLNTIPNDAVIARIKDKSIIINKNGIDTQDNTNKTQQNIGKKHKLPNANQERPQQKSYATSLNKAKIIGNIANKIERKVDNIVISNEGGFVATKELTAEDIQEMAHHGQEL